MENLQLFLYRGFFSGDFFTCDRGSRGSKKVGELTRLNHHDDCGSPLIVENIWNVEKSLWLCRCAFFVLVKAARRCSFHCK